MYFTNFLLTILCPYFLTPFCPVLLSFHCGYVTQEKDGSVNIIMLHAIKFLLNFFTQTCLP